MFKMYSIVADAGWCVCSNVCGTNVEIALELHESVCFCGSVVVFFCLALNVAKKLAVSFLNV